MRDAKTPCEIITDNVFAINLRITSSFPQMRSYQRAKELIRSAVRISDRDSILWNHYAKVEAALKNYPRARALFNRACDVNPTDWYVLTDKRLSGVKAHQLLTVLLHMLGIYQTVPYTWSVVEYNNSGFNTIL